MEPHSAAVARLPFTGIRNRRSRNRRPALACAAAVMVAGLAAAVFDGSGEIRPTSGQHAQVNHHVDTAGHTWHMPAE